MARQPSTHRPDAPYEGSALIADPIHKYVSFTVPSSQGDPHERTEKDLIDSPWVQRLRQIYQLQSARWVYPSAEHTRFVHSIGTMHVAGRFARHLYPFLANAVPDVPSANYVEEFLRVTALVHDIGHGPFCHFFDDNYLHALQASHEKLGQIIIRDHLGPIIRKIRRSPSGAFAKGEELNPDQIAHVILKEKGKDNSRLPRWLNMLQPVISGSYTADNLDYVLRDSYMCGVAVGPVDLTRLIHYTIITDKGFTIHKTGLPALQMFLNTRMYLYSNVYFHRTTRAIDIHLRDIFGDTMKLLFPHDPRKRMDEYLTFTDWSLLEAGARLEDVSSRRRTAPGRGMGKDSRPGCEVEDGLQHGAQGEGPGARDGLPEPPPFRKADSKRNAANSAAGRVPCGHGTTGSPSGPQGSTGHPALCV